MVWLFRFLGHLLSRTNSFLCVSKLQQQKQRFELGLSSTVKLTSPLCGATWLAKCTVPWMMRRGSKGFVAGVDLFMLAWVSAWEACGVSTCVRVHWVVITFAIFFWMYRTWLVCETPFDFAIWLTSDQCSLFLPRSDAGLQIDYFWGWRRRSQHRRQHRG